MSDTEKLEMLAAMTGETETLVLPVYLDIAKDIVLAKAYPYGVYPEVFPEKYDVIQIRIAEFLYNKRGAEGETSHAENGVSRQYENGDIPITLTRQITPMCGLPTKPNIEVTTNADYEESVQDEAP